MPRTRIKICGLTTADDIHAAVDAGADALGFNFHPPSPRYVDPGRATALLRSVPPFLDAVGVFVEQPYRQGCTLGHPLGLRSVQWVGERPPVDSMAPFPLVAAFRV